MKNDILVTLMTLLCILLISFALIISNQKEEIKKIELKYQQERENVENLSKINRKLRSEKCELESI